MSERVAMTPQEIEAGRHDRHLRYLEHKGAEQLFWFVITNAVLIGFFLAVRNPHQTMDLVHSLLGN